MATKKSKASSIKASGKDVNLNLRSAHTAIGKILADIDSVKNAVAVFDRGFDRTSPGFDRYYDRDRNMESIKDKVINPAEILKDVNIPK